MKTEEIDDSVALPTSHRVLDGCWLVHKIVWTARSTYTKVAEHYVDYIKRHFCQAVVVFYSYTDTVLTKNCPQLMRNKGFSRPTTEFSPNMKIVKSKEELLRSLKNKQRLIDLLTERLANSECKVLHAQDSADVLAVKTEVSCVETLSTTLIGYDTSLLVLLLYYTKLNAFDI